MLVADPDRERAFRVTEIPGVRVVDADRLIAEPLDVLAPCAGGGAITRATLGRLRAQVVCGAAADDLADDALADDLHAAGVLHVPGFVSGTGGIVRAGGAFLRWSDERIDGELDAAVARAGALLDAAVARGVPPLEAALAADAWTAPATHETCAIGPRDGASLRETARRRQLRATGPAAA